MRVKLITGPMFSGKSSYLVSVYDERTLAFKPIIDDRYVKECITTHDKKIIPSLRVKRMMEERNENIILERLKVENNFKIIIDEIQFIEDVDKFIEFLERNNYKGELIMSGLNGDFMRKSFNNFSKVIPYVNSIVMLNGRCSKCDGESIFTFRKSSDKSQVLVGSDDHYYPLCRKCFTTE